MNEKTCGSPSNTRKKERSHILDTAPTHATDYNLKIILWLLEKNKSCCTISMLLSDLRMVSGQNIFGISLFTNNLTYSLLGPQWLAPRRWLLTLGIGSEAAPTGGGGGEGGGRSPPTVSSSPQSPPSSTLGESCRHLTTTGWWWCAT